MTEERSPITRRTIAITLIVYVATAVSWITVGMVGPSLGEVFAAKLIAGMMTVTAAVNTGAYVVYFSTKWLAKTFPEDTN